MKPLALLLALLFLTGCTTSTVYNQGQSEDCAKYAYAKAIHMQTGYWMGYGEVVALQKPLSGTHLILGSSQVNVALEHGFTPVIELPMYANNIVTFRRCGIYRRNGRVVGTHAVVCVGYNDNSFECINSWGGGWGIGGRFWVREKDMTWVIGHLIETEK